MHLKKVLCTTVDKDLFNNDGFYDVSFGGPKRGPLCFGISMAFLGSFTYNDPETYLQIFLYLQSLHNQSIEICKSSQILDAPIYTTDFVLHHTFFQQLRWVFSEIDIKCFESSTFKKDRKLLIALYYADQSKGHAMSAHYSFKTKQLKCFYPVYKDSKNYVHIFSSSWINLLANEYIKQAQSYKVFHISKIKQQSAA